ncbi:hypothetical protein LOD99_11095 [Oopsacas minuta]|uniref:Ubiquitin-like protease family profile domain-containing protein n=1 Tax=Oopsacas minuta TaxID=111878 RepID=A0AAV7KBV5_9METZ|nr:hypothetical protein LOD99_11095 [Oopsacas minuta]
MNILSAKSILPLCRIIRGYRRNDNLEEPVNGVRDRSPHIAPQKPPRVVPKKFKKSPKKNIFKHNPVITSITSLPHSSSSAPVSDFDSSCSEGFLPGSRQFEHPNDDNRQFVRDPLPRMQIHHDGGLHWVCSSVDVEGNVRVYDSLATGRTSQELEIQLALLYIHSACKLTVAFAPIQQYRGGADCGFFAAAVFLQ